MSETAFMSLWDDPAEVAKRHDPGDNVLPTTTEMYWRSFSGNYVTQSSLLSYGPAFGAVSLISKDAAKLPLRVFRVDDNSREEARAHPLWRVLGRRPNGYMTPYIWKLQTVFHLLTFGNAYSVIRKDGQGRVQELMPLDPRYVNVRVVRSDGQWFYEIAFHGEDGFNLVRAFPNEILHVRGIGSEASGYSLTSVGRQSIGLATATQEFTQRFFSKGATASVAFMHPQSLSEEAYDRLRQSIERKYTGLENSWKPWLLEEDMKVASVSNSAEDAQLAELREQNIRDVANYWGVPPHRLGDTSKSSFASLEEENRSYLDTALDPVLCNLEEELEFKLLGTKDSVSHEIEFDRSKLTRANLADQATFYQGMVDRGIMSPAEVRRKLGENPDERCDVILIPQNMHVVQDAEDLEQINETPEPPPREPPPDDQGELDGNEPEEDENEVPEALRSLAQTALKAFSKRLDDHATKHGRAYWSERYEATMRPFLTERFADERIVDLVLSRAETIWTAAGQPVDLVPQLLPEVLEQIK